MMKYVRTMVARIHSKQDGVTALEYALIAALIAVVIIGAVETTGAGVSATFTGVSDALP